ncbi:MAG: hypothetical protein HMLKMBBP_01926 [Planctomycetes bacterium]|nr:hypothetical protein [Planctomycetota bacterium]
MTCGRHHSDLRARFVAAVVSVAAILSAAAGVGACGPGGGPPGQSGSDPASAWKSAGLEFRVLDAAGVAVAPDSIGIVEPSTSKIRWAWRSGGDPAVDRAPEVGDDIYVCHEDHGVAKARIDAIPFRGEIRLPPSAGRHRFRVVVDGAVPEKPTQVDVTFRLPGKFIPVEATADFTRPIWIVRRMHTAPDGTVEVRVPQGLEVTASLEPFGQVADPPTAVARGAGETVIRLTRYRRVSVTLPADSGDTCILALPDRLALRAMPTGLRAGAELSLGVNVPPRFLPQTGAAGLLRDVPPVPTAVFMRSGGFVHFAVLGPGRESLDLSGPPSPLPVREIPLLDGSPIPPGTLLLPGRHDLVTCAEASRAAATERGVPVVLGGENGWSVVLLPPCDTVTLWHPDRGLAHAAWDGTSRISGTTGPCSIRFSAPGRKVAGSATRGDVPAPFSGTFSVWEDVSDRATWFVKPGTPGLLRQAKDVVEHVIPGLPPGAYCVDFDVTEPGNPAKRTGTRPRRIKLDPAAPRAEIDVDHPGD